MLGSVAIALVLGPLATSIAVADGPVRSVVFGGRAVTPGEEVAAFAVGLSIETAEGHFSCTGSLIDREIVLTAAHCLLGNPTSITAVFTQSLSDWSSTVQIEEYRLPQNYNSEDDFEFDIAILRLAEPAPGTHRPVRLASPRLAVDQLQGVRVAGYGRESHLWDGDRSLGNENGDLRTAGVISANRQRNGQLEMATTKGTGTCSGDSGGPVFVRDAQGPIVIANTIAGSGRIDSCRGTAYSLKVGDWIPWINQQMRQLVGRTPTLADCPACDAPSTDAAPLEEVMEARTFTARAQLVAGEYLVTLSNSTPHTLKCNVSVFSEHGDKLQSKAVLAAFADGTLRLGPAFGRNVNYIVNCT